MPQVTAAGHALEFERIDGAPPVLVFLHEGLCSIRQWRDFPRRVARATGHAALIYDRYGYGASDVLVEPRVGPRFMHDAAEVELPALLRELRIEEPVLIGHSDGASIALIHAGAGHPVRALAVLAPHVFVEDVCLRSIEEARRRFEAGELRRKLERYHRDARRTFYLWNDAWLDPGFRAWSLAEFLPGIRCPVLALQGENDAYGTMAQLTAVAEGVRGTCELVTLPDCGHAPHQDRLEETLAALVRFLAPLA
jgi:pimeloyl-ACP methyl ester carboxylesterase